ncbi:hypothetical protein L1987_11159 [Smallanthus sonchifolius]|uniref:Uncharacterized protein n=1 Tax=Smallanthus sonchifolius TaxID=185202 RepID=A0ACB9JB11_9ASTR|nr:hypothetical protein L1987_11159 [Smallanthus sonchifolius]
MASNVHASSSCSGKKIQASDGEEKSSILFLKMLLDAIANERDSSIDVENLSRHQNEIERLNKKITEWKEEEITYYFSLLEFVSSFLKDTHQNPNESSSSPGEGSLKSLFKELREMRAGYNLLAITLNKILYEGELPDISTIHKEIEDRSRIIIKKRQEKEDPQPQDDPESSSSTLLEGVVNYQSENLKKILKQFVEEISNKDHQDRKTEGKENPNESFPVLEHGENDMQEARNEDPPQDVENQLADSSTGSNNQNGIQQGRNQNPLDVNENPAEWPTPREGLTVKKRKKKTKNYRLVLV